MPLFTVVTPTYQRRDTLRRAAASLARQTAHDFEWLVIDDGSTDGSDRLVRELAANFPVPVRYEWQENRGKHTALNRAFQLANGELTVVLDSDDTCVPEALERFAYHWRAIPAESRHRYTGVQCLCRDERGAILGDPYPRDILDSDAITMRLRFRSRGERWGCTRTDLLRAVPFPEPPGIRYIPESLVWDELAQRYRARFVNEALRVYWQDAGGRLTARDARVRQAPGLLLLAAANLSRSGTWFRHSPIEVSKPAVSFVRFALHLGLSPRRAWARLDPGLGRVLALAAVPGGAALWLHDRLLGRSYHAQWPRLPQQD